MESLFKDPRRISDQRPIQNLKWISRITRFSDSRTLEEKCEYVQRAPIGDSTEKYVLPFNVTICVRLK